MGVIKKSYLLLLIENQNKIMVNNNILNIVDIVYLIVLHLVYNEDRAR